MMSRIALRATLAVLISLSAALLSLGATDAQSDAVETQITARKAADGRVELCIYLGAEKQRRCPATRFFPYAEAPVGRWLHSSTLQIDDAALQVRARRDNQGWIEITLATTLGGISRVHTPRARFFNWQTTSVDRWVTSSSVTIGTRAADPTLGVSDGAARLQRGQPAPNFTLARLEGEGAISLSDFRGKTVALVFWSSWSPGAADLLSRLGTLRRTRASSESDLVVLAINVYDQRGAAARAFVEAGASIPGVIDEQAEVTRHYRVDGLPELLLIDPDGVYRERITGAAGASVIDTAINAANNIADNAASARGSGASP